METKKKEKMQKKTDFTSEHGNSMKKSSDPTKAQSLPDCWTKHIDFWSRDSAEYRRRRKALIDMMIETGKTAIYTTFESSFSFIVHIFLVFYRVGVLELGLAMILFQLLWLIDMLSFSPNISIISNLSAQYPSMFSLVFNFSFCCHFHFIHGTQ